MAAIIVKSHVSRFKNKTEGGSSELAAQFCPVVDYGFYMSASQSTYSAYRLTLSLSLIMLSMYVRAVIGVQ